MIRSRLGKFLAVNITNGGSGLSAVTWAITTTGGMNFGWLSGPVRRRVGAFPITDNGQNYAPGDSIAFNGAGFAAGAIVFHHQPQQRQHDHSERDRLDVRHHDHRGIPDGDPRGSGADRYRSLVTDLSASADPALTVGSYSADIAGKDLLIVYNSAGAAGNVYTLAATRRHAQRSVPNGRFRSGGAGPSSGTF